MFKQPDPEKEKKFEEAVQEITIHQEFEKYFSGLTPAEKLDEYMLLEKLIQNEEPGKKG